MPAVNKKGFTLMELLVAMSILAVLSALGLSSYIRSLKRGRDSQRKADLGQVQRALEAFANDHKGLYPDDWEGRLTACPNDGPDSTGGATCNWGSGEFKISDGAIYMKKLPKDPLNRQSYYYRSLEKNTAYQLYAKLENDDDPQVIETDVNCAAAVPCNYGVSSSNTTP